MRVPSWKADRAGRIRLLAPVPVLLALACVAALPCAARATYLPEERIPTDSPVYRDLERLSATYRVAPRFLSSRPLRRAEALAFLDELRAMDPEADWDPAFERAARELDPGATGATPPLIARTGEDGERLEISPYVSLRYDQGPQNRPSVNRDYRAGAALAASLDSGSVIVMNAYAGTASQGGRGTPNFGTFNSLLEGVDFNTWFEEAYVEFPVSRLRVLAGHTWLRWGPGRDGTLALSDAAPALDQLHAEATAFRNFRFQWFVAMLDPGPQSYLAGHRLEARLGSKLSVGFTEMARFTGTSQAPLYWMPLVPYSFWEKRPKTGTATAADTSGLLLHKNNVLWSGDLAWNFRPGARLWGELLVDDISFSNDYKPDLIGYQAGVQVRRPVAPGRMLGISAEVSRVNQFVYSHFTGEDFSFEGYPLGWVLGPDVTYSAGELTYEHSAQWQFGVRAEYRKKGEGMVGEPWSKSMGKVDASSFSGVVEKEVRVTWSAVYTPARWLRLEARVGTSQIKNLDHVTSVGWNADAPVTAAAKVVW
jgi:hypothetical protein